MFNVPFTSLKTDHPLGFPNGLGIAYLLGEIVHLTSKLSMTKQFPAQHKTDLGNKRVRKVEILSADTAASNMHEPTIYWEIEDSPIIWDELEEP